jgi:hypothetical protein
MWTGSAWDITTLDSAGDVGYYSSLAVDSNDVPHISYFDETNGYLKYAVWTGTFLSSSIVDSVDDVKYYTSLALDSDDNPHICYYDRTNDYLKYAVWNGSAWDISIVDSAGNVGEQPSLALDSNDIPHVSYRDVDNDHLKYAFLVTPPSETLNLQATASDGEVDLNWIAPSFDGGSPVTNYKIYRGTTSGSETFLVMVGDVLSFTDASVVNDQMYYYRVSAVNLVGEGLESSEVSAMPVVPDLSSVILLLSLVTATTFVGIIKRRKHTCVLT